MLEEKCAYCGEMTDMPFECNYCKDPFCSEHRLKLSVQGVTMVGFSVAYIAFMPFFTNTDKAHNVEPHAITAFCLLALAGALFFQARRAKINPENSLY